MNDRIIYIDDNIDDSEPLVKKLRKKNFQVRIITDSKDALECIRNQSYDIVLLDLDMGERSISGNHLFHELRKVDKKVPVIIISGFITTQTPFEYVDFIKNQTAAIFDRKDDNAKIAAKIEEVREELNTFPGGALEDWIQKTKDPNAVLMVTKDGRKFTAADILKELKLRTPLGLQFEKEINQLTIDLIARGKEKI